ncbi:8-oxoguanine deaminase [Rhizocola hellebori]|uniref:8-oxoguanine deaminase n=1 Tax=Rhizocola hellebori TaxID=1392758 RepID=A0A8J3Q914_9ACTN|nr:8-oxoguanine deaminase [Rhizocola hellebori]GIH05438.1 8-oxoguanine deaminase [Rhizocola hellebori]
MTLIIENCAIATVSGPEHASGHLVIEGEYLTAVGAGPAPRHDNASYVDASGCLATPGLVNTHHHLYQWATRGLAQDETLFGWLKALYPIWARIDYETVHAAAAAGLGWLARTGCTTSSDHHYVFPRDGGDLLAAEIEAARAIGLRFHPTRGSMDRGVSDGGLPPDSVVEDLDTILSACADAIAKYHDPAPNSMLRIGIAPCSPFSVSSRLMTESAALARQHRVRLHTHLAETLDEEEFCLATHGCTPAEYADSLGWLADDVWMAHGVHLSESAIKRFAETGTGTAHCPSSNARLGAGLAPVKALLRSGAPVGLGVDGAASQESGMMVEELRQAMYASRLRAGTSDPAVSLNARDALYLGTMGGARNLGRQDEIGSLEPGKLADIALWRLDGLGHADIADPVAALVFGPPAPLKLLLVGGRPVVADDALSNADERALASAARAANRKLTEAT